MSYQRLWLYNGAPLVEISFYDTLGYGGRILDLNPLRPHGGPIRDLKDFALSIKVRPQDTSVFFKFGPVCLGIRILF